MTKRIHFAHAYFILNKWQLFHFTNAWDSSIWIDTARKGINLALSVGPPAVYLDRH